MEMKEKCQNCGRNLEENEVYCHFCEMDISELSKKAEKKPEKQKH